MHAIEIKYVFLYRDFVYIFYYYYVNSNRLNLHPNNSYIQIERKKPRICIKSKSALLSIDQVQYPFGTFD